ncbi:hypothetical protein FQR65_LT20122 [Abscondita terminalis]|nr:hypothetical protein FQR65_LT20122 [Abscondita terminalis]
MQFIQRNEISRPRILALHGRGSNSHIYRRYNWNNLGIRFQANEIPSASTESYYGESPGPGDSRICPDLMAGPCSISVQARPSKAIAPLAMDDLGTGNSPDTLSPRARMAPRSNWRAVADEVGRRCTQTILGMLAAQPANAPLFRQARQTDAGACTTYGQMPCLLRRLVERGPAHG